MKKTLLSVAVVLAGLGVASAQGTIKFYNASSLYAVSTNASAIGGTTGHTTTAANQFYYALLMQSGTAASQDPLTGGWSVATTGGTNLMASNYTLVAGGLNGTGSTLGTTVNNWAPGSAMNVEIVGWSASLGTTWDSIAAQLATGWKTDGFYGISSIGVVSSGGAGTPASPAAALFGTGGQIATGWSLNAVAPVPEPATMALAALGGASLLLFRRRK